MSSADEDFRRHRSRLPPEAFALRPESPEPRPQDIVEYEVWHTIMSLPDDVSIKTSDDYGTELKAMVELWASVIDMSVLCHDVWDYAVLNMADGLQAATFNALSGYYGTAASCLRSVLETASVAAYLQLEGTVEDALKWQKGQDDLKFGFACKQVMGNPRIIDLEAHVKKETKHSIFSKPQKGSDAGWARRLFGDLSNYAHARPTHSDGSLREASNGPIFVPSSFLRIYKHYLDVCALLYVGAKLCRPDMDVPASSKWLFQSPAIRSSPFSVCCFEYLWDDESISQKAIRTE